MTKTKKALKHLKEGKLSKRAIALKVGCTRTYIYELIKRYPDNIHKRYLIK